MTAPRYKRVSSIFKRRWHVHIPDNATYSPQWLNQNGGHYTSGSKYWDQRMKEQTVDRMLTIEDLVHLTQKGVKITLAKGTDILEMYRTVHDYLSYAARLFSRMTDPEVYTDLLSDLRELDEFASILYQTARYDEPDYVSTNPFIQQLRSLHAGFGFGFNDGPVAQGSHERHANRSQRVRPSLSVKFAEMMDPDRIPGADDAR